MIKHILLSLVFACYLCPVLAHAKSDNVLQQGEAAINAGQINQAITLFQQAQQQAQQPQMRWLASIGLVDALIRAGKLDYAEVTIQQIYQEANSKASASLVGEMEIRYGHLYSAQGDKTEAIKWYKRALTNANKGNDLILVAAAAINLNKQIGDLASLTKAHELLSKLPAGEQRNDFLLTFAYQALQQQQTKLAYDGLLELLKSTQSNERKAQAYGYLGQLYEQKGLYADALRLTDQALLIDTAPDIHMLWNWQKARIFANQGNNLEAVTTYRSAVLELQTIRQDIPVMYHSGRSSFKETFAPMYLGFLELLLQRAQTEVGEQQVLLEEALSTWEQLKVLELQDYFKDACAVKQKAVTTAIEAHTAILYPIILNKSLALVLRTNQGLKAYSVAHTRLDLEHAITQMTRQLIDEAPLTINRKLYDWLIRPLEKELQQQSIDTLVYLPDGILRKVPFSLLHDGSHYLIEQYALVTIPGLSMLAAPSVNIPRDDILLTGVSEPGSVVEELLDAGIDILEPPEEAQRSASRAIYIGNMEDRQISNMDRNLQIDGLKEELALPGVSEELKILAELTDNPVLENSRFLLKNFKQSVNQGHIAVHIASHGYFSGNPKKSFVLLYDHLLNLEQLSELFQTEAFHNRPVELVTLSACQTAEGDDRSPLGLSGVVVQAGVKSALGTLWPVVDEAAKQFFSDFYKLYQQPNMTKAKAMQIAQKKLMQNQEMSHPSFWGPFILVGEWH